MENDSFPIENDQKATEKEIIAKGNAPKPIGITRKAMEIDSMSIENEGKPTGIVRNSDAIIAKL